MKKITVFLLTLLLACSTMMGCQQDTLQGASNENEAGQQESTDDKDDTDETLPPFEDVITEYDQDDSQQGFSIKGKRYYYEGCVMDQFMASTPYPAGEVLLLNVTNETDINYSATLTVTYLGENGEKIKTEKQTFEQFAAGYQRYFLFTPKSDYASYTCELSLTEYTGEILADKFSFSGIDRIFEHGSEIDKYWLQNDDTKKYPSILANLKIEEHPRPQLKYVGRKAIIFDNTGEIYLIQDVGGSNMARTESITDYTSIVLYQTTEEKLVWPEELKGELKAIVIFDIER